MEETSTYVVLEDPTFKVYPIVQLLRNVNCDVNSQPFPPFKRMIQSMIAAQSSIAQFAFLYANIHSGMYSEQTLGTKKRENLKALLFNGVKVFCREIQMSKGASSVPDTAMYRRIAFVLRPHLYLKYCILKKNAVDMKVEDDVIKQVYEQEYSQFS